MWIFGLNVQMFSLDLSAIFLARRLWTLLWLVSCFPAWLGDSQGISFDGKFMSISDKLWTCDLVIWKIHKLFFCSYKYTEEVYPWRRQMKNVSRGEFLNCRPTIISRKLRLFGSVPDTCYLPDRSYSSRCNAKCTRDNKVHYISCILSIIVE